MKTRVAILIVPFAVAALLLCPAGAGAQTVDYVKIQGFPGCNLIDPANAAGRIVGGGIPEHNEQVTVWGYDNGPNGIPEDGGGDDQNLGPVAATFTTDLGTISPNGLWTAPPGALNTGVGTITATLGALSDSVIVESHAPDWVPYDPEAITDISCTVSGLDVNLAWTLGDFYDSVRVYRDGLEVANLPATSTAYVDSGVGSGGHYYEVMGDSNGNLSLPPAYCHVFLSTVVSAEFIGFPTFGGAPLLVQFTDLSTGPLVDWQWDFGDGGTSAEQSPLHLYANPGIYTVSLTATGSTGTDTEIKTDYIDVGDPDDILKIEDQTAFSGQTALTVPLLGTTSLGLDGFGASLNFPGDLLDVSDVHFDGSAPQAANAEFLNPLWGESPDFITIEVIMDTIPPFGGQQIPPGTDEVFATVIFEVNGTFVDGDTRDVQFVDGLGPDQVQNVFLLPGYDLPPFTENAVFTFFEQPLFTRGDCNNDGVVNLPDAVFELFYLFAGGLNPACFSACDNDDSGNLNLGDVIYLLFYLFVPGSPMPPLPFPDAGPDPTPDSLPCG